jgi:hypothetical protein
MNLTNLTVWAFGIVSTLMAAHHIEDIHRAIVRAQAQVLYESRTETWGSPRCFGVHSGGTMSVPGSVQNGNPSNK